MFVAADAFGKAAPAHVFLMSCLAQRPQPLGDLVAAGGAFEVDRFLCKQYGCSSHNFAVTACMLAVDPQLELQLYDQA